MIEQVQRRATKYILNDFVNDYNARLQSTGLLPLSYRREICDATFMYNCLNNNYNMNINKIVTFTQQGKTRSTSEDHELNLRVKKVNTESYKHYYTNRIVNIWNNILNVVRLAPLSETTRRPRLFKKYIKIFYTQKRDTLFDCNNTCTWVTNCRCMNCRS